MTYEELKEVNKRLPRIPIHKKEYATVAARVQAFRELYPEGFIRTSIIAREGNMIIMQAEAGIYDRENDMDLTLGIGTASEEKTTDAMHRTSYIEICETSAIGRALGFLGIGSETSIASAEEVRGAITAQERLEEEEQYKAEKAMAYQIEELKRFYKGQNEQKLFAAQGIAKWEDLSAEVATRLLSQINRNGTADDGVEPRTI